MVIEGQFVIPAPFDDVMKLFSNVPRLAEFLPGCSDVDPFSDTRYRAKMTTQVKFMTLNFDVEGEMTDLSIDDLVEDESGFRQRGQIEAQMTGTPTALAGIFRTILSVTAASMGPHETEVDYRMNASLTGRLASIGELMMRSSIQKNTDEFTKNVIAHFQELER